jgi:hypothetical protein
MAVDVGLKKKRKVTKTKKHNIMQKNSNDSRTIKINQTGRTKFAYICM